MVVIVFRSRLRPGAAGHELEQLGMRMYALASAMPGFISYSEYSSGDESVALVEFASHETLAAWRNHPEHVSAQQQGRERYFSEYRISVCEVVREYAFPTAGR